jgi:hypothetical protein
MAGSPVPIDLLPAGAVAVIEVHDAEELAERIKETRFAAAYAKSATRAWLEQTEAFRSFDTLFGEIRKVTGLSVGRESAFDLIGSDIAVGWYPAASGGAPGPHAWVAGGRLSWRAWAAAALLRTVRRLGFGSAVVGHEEVAGRTVYTIRGGSGQSLHLFLAGRVLAASPDRSLVLQTARGERGAVATGDKAGWRSLRSALPKRGELFVWVRDRGLLQDRSAPAPAPGAGVAALLRAGKVVEIDVIAEPLSLRQEPASTPLPATALLDRSPLFFFASRDPVPLPLADLLQDRSRAVARREPPRTSPEAAIRPGSGYALVITENAGGSGLLPAPRGILVVGMGSAGEAARSLPLLFPHGARTAAAGGTRALATRESFPLAGEFELWGAAIGPRLVFATDTALIDAVSAAEVEGNPKDRSVPEPGWQVRALAAISMEKALPLLRRWAAPLSGLMAARWPEAPDISRDVELLAALGDVRVIAGSDDRRDRAAITLQLRDLP